MPTPFMHLQAAEQIRAHPRLLPAVARQLDAAWPAFYLGNVAPDFQTISDVPRSTAHFYDLPPAPGVEAHQIMLEKHPGLREPVTLMPEQAVFIAGYRAHLLLDLRWYWDVLIPYFVEAKDWPVDHRQRFLVHNILLTYLDNLALDTLPAGAGDVLAQAQPHHWLPFAGDGDLIRWRDMLSRQLQPGEPVETVAIYAERMQLSPEAFAAHLADETWIHEQVFRKVPLETVQSVLAAGMEASVTLLNSYLERM